jgi:chromate transporter
MAIGLVRARYAGLIAAFLGFTLPSALMMAAFAYGAAGLAAVAGSGWIAGLKAAAVAVVANAVLGMAGSLTPDRERAAIAVLAMAIALLIPFAAGQVLAIIAGGAIGLLWLRPGGPPETGDAGMAVRVGHRPAILCLTLFLLLLLALPPLAAESASGTIRLLDSFYRAGSLVFGGGHVVLPLLQAEVVDTGLVDRDAFLAGYGAAQAVPGPLFSFAAFLGAVAEQEPSGPAGALTALLAIYLPSGLLLIGTLPFWARLRSAPLARRGLYGVNAAVVGLLAAALYDPVFMTGITSPASLTIAASCLVALAAWKAPAWAVVLAAATAGLLVL